MKKNNKENMQETIIVSRKEKCLIFIFRCLDTEQQAYLLGCIHSMISEPEPISDANSRQK